MVILRLTDGDGDAQAQLPIPAAAAGQSVTTQWATLTSFGNRALLGGFAPSNALLTTIAW